MKFEIDHSLNDRMVTSYKYLRNSSLNIEIEPENSRSVLTGMAKEMQRLEDRLIDALRNSSPRYR